jgi:hypothetical protein
LVAFAGFQKRKLRYHLRKYKKWKVLSGQLIRGFKTILENWSKMYLMHGILKQTIQLTGQIKTTLKHKSAIDTFIRDYRPFLYSIK